MYCQKCGTKIYKNDKYCGHCGKSLLHNDDTSSRRNEKTLDEVYKHNLDVVFGYALSPDAIEASTEVSEDKGQDSNRSTADDYKKATNDRELPSDEKSEYLQRPLLNFAKQVFTKPHYLIQSKQTYRTSLLWLHISIILFIGSVLTVNSFDAAFYPQYYFYYIVLYMDYYYITYFDFFYSFFWNIIFLIIIYIVSVIINTIIRLREEYAVFNFRDIIILSSLAMVISIVGSVLIFFNFSWLGDLLSRIGTLTYIASPFLLSAFYIKSGRTEVSARMLASISLAAIALIIVIIHINLSTY